MVGQKTELVTRLLDKGDLVAIANGRLVIEPASREPVPPEWFEENETQMLQEILQQAGRDAFRYKKYQTGNYGERRSGGVNLQFRSVLGDLDYYVIFNAEIRRRRNSNYGKAGSTLPRKQFYAGRRSSFTRLWRDADLPQPQREGQYGNYMGKLKGMLFTGTIDHGERLLKSSLRPLSISHGQLMEMFGVDCPNKTLTKPIQNPDNSQTTIPNKHSAQPQVLRVFPAASTAGTANCGNTVIRECGYKGPSKPPQEQTNEEWWEDYERRDRELSAAATIPAQRWRLNQQ